MKRFLLNSLLFIVIAIGLFHIKPLYLLINNKYKQTVAGSEIYYSIEKSKKKNKSKKVLFGDSVARQMFDNKTNNDTVNSLACNQAISLVGQFILLTNYLEAGNEVDTVYFLFRPFTFQNNLNQVFTYHYFLKPFYKEENNKYFTSTVIEQVKKIPFNRFCRYPSILTSNWAPNFSPKDVDNHTFLSPISIEYLGKIKDLATKYNFKLIILPTPMNAGYKSRVAQLDTTSIAKAGFQNEFKNYFKNIMFLDPDKFIDSSHIKIPLIPIYLKYYRDNLIK